MPDGLAHHHVTTCLESAWKDDRTRTRIEPVKHASILPGSEKPADSGALQLWPVSTLAVANLGAGEGARTLDPDLGKVRVTRFPVFSRDYPSSLVID